MHLAELDRRGGTRVAGVIVELVVSTAYERYSLGSITPRHSRMGFRLDLLRDVVDREGWVSTPPVLPPRMLNEIATHLGEALADVTGRGGLRNLLDSDQTVRGLAAAGPLRDAATAVLGPVAGAVRAILFDKTPVANWKVIWHQDLTIAVAEQQPTPGYGPWSLKEGVVHVQAPVAILEQMLAVRLHLDDSTSDNGPVRVLSGSHRSGRLQPDDVKEWRGRVDEVECLVARGGLLLFRPLLLHASSPSRHPTHRRVLHLEYGPPELAQGLRWHTWVAGVRPETA